VVQMSGLWVDATQGPHAFRIELWIAAATSHEHDSAHRIDVYRWMDCILHLALDLLRPFWRPSHSTVTTLRNWRPFHMYLLCPRRLFLLDVHWRELPPRCGTSVSEKRVYQASAIYV
jgi:hypothetical protein